MGVAPCATIPPHCLILISLCHSRFHVRSSTQKTLRASVAPFPPCLSAAGTSYFMLYPLAQTFRLIPHPHGYFLFRESILLPQHISE